MHLFICLSPLRSQEQNITLPHFFHQRKELCLVKCTNWLMSSLLECKVVNTLFAFLSSLDAQRTKPCPVLQYIRDIYKSDLSACKVTVARFFKWLQHLNATVKFSLVSSTLCYRKSNLYKPRVYLCWLYLNTWDDFGGMTPFMNEHLYWTKYCE